MAADARGPVSFRPRAGAARIRGALRAGGCAGTVAARLGAAPLSRAAGLRPEPGAGRDEEREPPRDGPGDPQDPQPARRAPPDGEEPPAGFRRQAVVNDYVFDYRKAPIKELEITTTDEGQLRQEGVLDKAVDIPFKVKAELLPTPDGRIRVHAKSIKAGGLPVKGLMGLLGIEMDDMVKIQAGRGIVVDDNDFILDPQQMLPPPRIRGKVTSVRIDGDQVIQVFGATCRRAGPRPPEPPRARSARARPRPTLP